MIRIAGYIPRASISDLARDAAECVPDGISPTVLVWCAFDLVANWLPCFSKYSRSVTVGS
jgi:hypothetical protein